MKALFSGVIAQATALWRPNADLLLRIVGVFFFLPALAQDLFLTRPKPGDTIQNIWQNIIDWELQNIQWLIPSALIQSLGSAVVLVLLIDRSRPRLDEALLRALRLLPGLILIWLVSGMLVAFGTMALIVPGLFLLGRMFVVGAAYVDHPEQGPFGALTDAVQRTRGNGWLLCGIALGLMFASALLLTLAQALVSGLAVMGVSGPVHGLIADVATAAISTLEALAQLLLQAAAYQLLTRAGESEGRPRG